MSTYVEKIAAGRKPCQVPGCGRTFKGGGEHLCRRHWLMVPPYQRRRMSMLRRRYIAVCGSDSYWVFPAGSHKRMQGARIWRLFMAAWEACKRSAIQRAVGI